MKKLIKTRGSVCRLLRGDCLKLLKRVPDNSVDMVLCDLPYGTTQNKWDVVIPLDKLWKQYKRVAREHCAFVFTAAQPFTTQLINSNPKMFRYCWVWQKENGTGFLNANRRPLVNHEDILVFFGKDNIYNPQMSTGHIHYRNLRKGEDCKHNGRNYGKIRERIPTKNKGTRFPLSVVFHRRCGSRIHPTQKPVELMEYLIRTYTDEGMTILDNCMGSGTTGVACINTNRNFVGMEKDATYFRIGYSRMLQAKLCEPTESKRQK